MMTHDDALGCSDIPPFWCPVCKLDLQSKKSLLQHKLGIKHQKREQRQPCDSRQHPTREFPSRYAPIIEEEELFQNLASGVYKNIVVLTGAGVSTAAGVPDFRSPGGLFDTLRRKYHGRFPGVDLADTPEILFSREFANTHPEVYYGEIFPSKQKVFQDARPTLTHHFCAHLYHMGWLKRLYTQNIDGLHLHPSLVIPEEDDGVVVECHGSMRTGNLVLYGDPLPKEFFEKASRDFHPNSSAEGGDKVDLILVFGTSLRVAPVCGLPNMALKGCTRVLVNRDLSDCMVNDFSVRSATESSMGVTRTCDIGSRKNVQLRPLWRDRKAMKKWSQLLVEDGCDAFVERFMKTTGTVFCHRREVDS